MFNGFKTAVRTRGSDISFDEAVTLLNSEDLQLLQDNPSESDTTTVLVAAHENPSHNSHQNSECSQSQINVPTQPQMHVSGPPNFSMPTSSQFVQPQSQTSYLPQQQQY